MRVLHIINDLRIGGAEVLLKDLLPRQRAAGIDADLIALVPNVTFLRDELSAKGVPVREHPAGLGFYGLRHIPLLARAMRDAAPDLVHVHLFPAQFWAAFAAALLPQRKRPRLVTTEHNTSNRRREKAVFRPIEAAMYARYARILCISPATEAALHQWLPDTRGRTVVVPNGVDLSRFANVTPLPKAEIVGAENAHRPLILSVGRLEPQKAMETLILALHQVPEAMLAIVGDGPMRGELEQVLTPSLKLTDRVRFLGRRSDVPALLASAEIYAQSSRWEGFGIATVEAMASGTPVVVSDVPGLSEVVGEAGVRVAPPTRDNFAGALAALLADPAKRRRFAKAGREAAKAFSIEHCLRAHLDVYRSLSGR